MNYYTRLHDNVLTLDYCRYAIIGEGTLSDALYPTAEVREIVLGECGGQALTQPWVVNLQPYLEEGLNEVEVDVVSSLRNAFGPLHHKQGDALKFVGPQQFSVDDLHWTDQYQFAPYGLLAPPKMLIS